MKGKSVWLLLPCILLLVAAPAFAAPPSWVQVAPTNENMFVFGTVTVSINHIPVPQSSANLLGAFVPGLATPNTVVGLTDFGQGFGPGEYSMPIYGNDSTTPAKDGANAGDNVTFQLYYAPEDQLLSTYTFIATDELGNPLSAVQYGSFLFDNVTINFNMDLRPVWDNLSVFFPKSVNEGANLQFTAHATDPDGTAVTLAANNLPGFCTYNTTSGLVNCNPTFADNGTYNVTFRASSTGLFALPDNAAVTITVANVNRAPVFDTITPAGNVSGNQGSTFTKAFTYSDPDVGDTVTFSTDAPLPPFCSESGTGNARTITCSPTLPSQQGTYAVTARITDNGTPAPLSTPHTFNVVVTNRAPVISGLSNAAYDNNSTTPAVQTLSVTDADGNAIVASVCAMTPSKPWFAFDNVSLTAPRITIQGPMPAGDVGPYTINCASTDDGTPPLQGTASATLTISSDPVWTPVPGAQSGSENTQFSFTVHASDAFGGTIVYTVSGLAPFCGPNGATGQVLCTPDFTASGTYNQIFRAQVISGANAGKFATPDNAAVTITIANVNRAPVFDTITPPGNVSGNQGSTFTKAFTYSDPDVGDTVTFSTDAPLPPFCSVSGTGNARTITCSPTLPSQQGTYAVTARITDNGTPAPLSTPHTFNVVVTNRAPVISGLSNAAYDNNSTTPAVQTLSVTDADGNAIVASVCAMTPSKPWFAFDNSSLTAPRITIQGPMPAGDVGPYTINCASTDDGTPPLQGTASATLIISSDPIWSPVPGNQSGSENTPFNFTVHAFDAFGGTVAYTVSGLAPFCGLNGSTGQVTCTPDFTASGTYNPVFRAQVTSGANAGKYAAPDNAAVTITVANVNRAPVFDTITPPGNVSGNQGSTFTKGLMYSDPDGNTITFTTDAALPPFCSVSGAGNARTITCSPTLPSHQGTYPVTARITDNGTPAPLDNTHTFSIVVTNRAPAISGLSNAVYDNNSTTPAVQTLSVTDADGNAIVASVCAMTPSKPWFAFDNASLTAPRITIQGPMSAGDVALYTINCVSTDNGTPSLQGTASATLNVTSNPTWQPVPANQSGSEGTPFNFTVHATDPLGGTIVYTATGLPSFCPLNASTGQVSCTPDFTASGTYNPVFRAQSTTGANAGKYAAPDNAAITITIANVNRAPVFGTVTPAGNVNGPINTTFTKTFAYSDPDGDAITFDNVAPLPSFCSVSGTGNSRTITCNPTLPSQQGSYPVTVRITDNGTPAPLNNTQSFTITVDNRPPTVSVSAATAVDTGGGNVTIPVTFFDPDGNGIPVRSCTASGSPSWFSFDAGTNMITVATAGITFANDIDTATGQKAYNFSCTATDNGTPATSVLTPANGTITLFRQPHFPATVATTAQKVTFGGAVGKGGIPAVSGDEVYVYSVNPRPGTAIPNLKYDRKLVGHAFITSTGFTIDAYGDDPGTTGTIEGLVNGEEALFLLYSAADAKVYTAYKVNTTGWSLVWNDAIPGQTVTLDFIDGQRYPLVDGAWNLFGYGVMKGYSVGGTAPAGVPQLSGLSTWANVADVGASEPLLSIAGKYDRVIGNDGAGAKLWNPDVPRFSSLTYLAPGYGYWIKMKASARKLSWITVPGTPAAGTETMSLGAGWVLLAYPGQRVYVESGYDATGDLLPIGAPSSTTLTPTGRMGDFWSAVDTKYDRATSFDTNGTKLWSPALPSASTMRYMAPGYGYWLHMTVPGILSYPEGGPG